MPASLNVLGTIPKKNRSAPQVSKAQKALWAVHTFHSIQQARYRCAHSVVFIKNGLHCSRQNQH